MLRVDSNSETENPSNDGKQFQNLASISFKWKKQNEEYRQKIKERKLANDVYSMTENIIDPDIPLRNNLVLVKSVNSIFPKAALKMKCKPMSGASGKVRIIQFKNDPDRERWFAIKSPHHTEKEERFFLELKAYENNLKMSLKIGDHPNFMNVHALCIKKLNQSNIKPYLVLSYCDGSKLNDCELTLEEMLTILYQLKDAILHLYDCDIYPHDAGTQNIIFSKENNRVKLIDYDRWIVYETKADLTPQLYGIISGIAHHLGQSINFHSMRFDTENLISKSQLESAIDDLIIKFKWAHNPINLCQIQ